MAEELISSEETAKKKEEVLNAIYGLTDHLVNIGCLEDEEEDILDEVCAKIKMYWKV